MIILFNVITWLDFDYRFFVKQEVGYKKYS